MKRVDALQREKSSWAYPGIVTWREREVLTLSAQGLTSAEIAEKLGISKRTVDEHVRSYVRKLQAKNRTHAVAIAMRARMIRF